MSNRAIDTCTCGQTREFHEKHFMDHEFFPNPQPTTNMAPADVAKRVLDFLSTLGSVHQTSRFTFKDEIVLTMPDGAVWTMGTPVNRKGTT